MINEPGPPSPEPVQESPIEAPSNMGGKTGAEIEAYYKEKNVWINEFTGPKDNEGYIITPRLDEILQWTGALTTEQNEDPDYIETREVQILKNRLTRLKGQLIVVLGLQGIGKTALRQHLANELENTLSLKWTSPRDFIRIITEAQKYEDPLAPGGYATLLMKVLNRRIGFVGLPSKMRYAAKLLSLGIDLDEGLATRIYEWQSGRLNAEDLEGLEADVRIDLVPLIEVFLPPRDLARVENTFAKAAVNKLDTILIDFPDYDRRTRTQALKDLKDFQIFWEGMNFAPGEGYNIDGETPNIILFWQQENWQADHFLQGKFQKLQLRPFTATELIDLYINKFEDPWPFTEGALEALVALSRGIPRWFKKYVGLCLDNYLIDKPELITPRHVEEWVPVTQIVEDMTKELIGVFPRSKKHRQRTVIVKRFLQEHGRTAQLDLTQRFFGPDKAAETEASRFFTKLEEAGYVTREFEGRCAFIGLPEG